MLISLPFLREDAPQEADVTGSDTFSLAEKSGKGGFPVSFQFGWHGGVHLTALNDNDPVRAIADGEVVFARNSDPMPLNSASPEIKAAHPLLYYTGWTSNGVMILKHTTEIGEDVSVTFYSIYQHLHTLEKKPNSDALWKAGDRVYRKDPIGKAGFIYGRPNCIHFEIVADKANVDNLMGRSQGPLTAPEGRRNSVWGDMHILLPAHTPLYEQNPRSESKPYLVRAFNPALGAPNDTLESVAQRFGTTPERIRQCNGTPAKAANWWGKVTGAAQLAANQSPPTPAQRTIQVPAVYGAAVATPPAGFTAEDWRPWQSTVIGYTAVPLIVSLSESRGTITLTTRAHNGAIVGTLTEAEGGYNLYKAATDTYPGCPSAGYEMLRFGRVLGPDAPAPSDLHDGRLPHFRQIVVPGAAQAFADLNGVGVQVYSDADFPHWLGWTFIDDDNDGNSRCDSTQLLDLIEPISPASSNVPSLPGMLGEIIHSAAQALDVVTGHRDRLLRAYAKVQSGSLRERLSYCVVKQPTEWSRDDFDKRWGWIKGDNPDDLPANIVVRQCMSEESYERLKRHHQALAFWEEAAKAGFTLDKVHYHFHPLRFIEMFKKCGWLSPVEMVQLLPATGIGLTYNQALVLIRDGQSTTNCVLPSGMWKALNIIRRKYQVESILRTAHFWGQIAQETDGLQTVREYASGADYEGRTDLGNTHAGDGVRFRGRGVIQITGRANYSKYENYRNSSYTIEPNQLQLQSSAYIASDASGLYWASESTRDRYTNPPGSAKPFRWVLDGKININTRADTITFVSLADEQSILSDVLNVTRQVNRAALHLDRRVRYFKHAYKILSDDVSISLPGGNLRS